RHIVAIWVQIDGGNGVNPSVFLHIGVEKDIHAILEKLPQHAHSHGEAKSHQRHKGGGQLHPEFLGTVQNVHHGNADGSNQKAVHGVEHGVPKGENEVILLNFPQNLRRENKQQDDNF